MIGPIHHATLSVSNLERSIAFYRDVLGFRQTVTGVVDDEEHERYLRLRPGTAGRATIMQAPGHHAGSVELVEWRLPDGTLPAAPSGPKRPGDPGVCLLAFEVTGERVHDVCERVRTLGLECWTEPESMHIDGYGEITAVVLEDPDGVMIELLTLPSLDEARRARRTTPQSG